MKKIRENIGAIICVVALIVVNCVGIGIVGLTLTEHITDETISTEMVEGIVTNTDYSTHYIKNSGTKTSYVVSVRGDDFAKVFSVNSSTYAKYAVGDTATIERIEKYNKIQGTYFEYELK